MRSFCLPLMLLILPLQTAYSEEKTPDGALELISYNLAVSSNKKTQKNFCDRMSQSLQKYADANQKGQTQGASLMLVDQILAGTIAEYLPLSSLSLKNPSSQLYTDAYISTTNVLRDALGLSAERPAVMVYASSDLRYLPTIQNGTELLILAKNSDPVEGNNALLAAATAERLNIRVNVIWYGPEIKDLTSFRPASGLALVAQKTGGQFVSLSGSTNPCGTKS